MARSKGSRAWLHEHTTDPYVRRAQKEGYRSRAAYKLLEINAKDTLLRPGMTVIDLGAAPGGWSQIVAQKVAPAGKIIALDLLAMEPITGVAFIQGDFSLPMTQEQIEAQVPGGRADLVLSDLAPNVSGIASMDQARVYALAEAALGFAANHLQPNGAFLVKVFQGVDFAEFRKQMEETFRHVSTRKPHASRDRSNELYLLGRDIRLA